MPRPREPAHARFYAEWLDLPAWRSLSCPARALLIELLARYRPAEPNRFDLGERRIASQLQCGRATARRALEELEDRGWIVLEATGGGMNGPVGNRAAAYSLTLYMTADRPATKAFLHWGASALERSRLARASRRISAATRSWQRRPAPRRAPLQ